MALIQCSECGHMISDRAKKCPKCGCPTDVMFNKDQASKTEKTNSQNLQDTALSAEPAREMAVSKNKKALWLVLAALALIVACGGLWLFTNQNSADVSDSNNVSGSIVTSESANDVAVEQEMPEDQSDLDMYAPAEEVGIDVEPVDESNVIAETPPAEVYSEENVKESTRENHNNSDEVLTIAEVMPKFQGDVTSWLARNIEYPEDAAQNNIQGKVFVRFIINEEGEIINPKIVKSVSPSVDAEALRVVRAMPRWTPGYNNGSPCKVEYTLPVNFKLN